MFLNISRFTKNELDKSFKSKIGVDIFTGEPNLQELMNLWVDDNVNLITSFETQFFDKVKANNIRSYTKWYVNKKFS